MRNLNNQVVRIEKPEHRKNFEVLIFSPFAAIWQHSLPEQQFAAILSKSGFEVTTLSCERDYQNFCTAMEAFKISVKDQDETKQKICSTCISSRKQLANYGNARGVKQEKTPQANSATLPMNINEMISFSLEGIQIGQIALYETLIKYKKTTVNLDEAEENHFRISLENATKVFYQAESYFEKSHPNVVICYSPQYGIPGVFAAVAKKHGIRVLFMEASSNDSERYSHLRIWEWEKYGLTQPALNHPENFERFYLTLKRKERAERQLRSRSNSAAFSVYSSAPKGRDIYEYFNLDKNKKTILLSMSSYDEVYSGYKIGRLPLERYSSKVFNDQIEWLEQTIDWAKSRPELQIIVRPHPREFPNKREKETSPHALAWARVLESVPDNVRVDHPNLGFSLFDHLRHVDVLTTGWSSTGIDALANGIPVVTYDSKLPTFPASIHLTGTTREEYFANLEAAVLTPRSQLNVNNALRWLAYTSEVGTVRIGGRATDRIQIDFIKPIFRYLNSKYFKVLMRPLDLLLRADLSQSKKIEAIVLGRINCLYESIE